MYIQAYSHIVIATACIFVEIAFILLLKAIKHYI